MKDLKKALLRGERLTGPLITCPSPSIVEIAGNVGFDWVLIDSEHSATSPAGRDLENMVRAAYASGIAPTVRVSDNSENQINNALNIGAKAVWIPHVETPEAAEQAVRAFHYSPKGERGAAPIVRAAQYGLIPFDEYKASQAEETFLILILIIESLAGLNQVDEIAAVAGVDALCFGTFDMAVDMGLDVKDFYSDVQDRWIHPKLEEAGMKVLHACQTHNVILVTAAWGVETGQEWMRRGYKMMLFGLDMAIFTNSFKTLKAQTDKIKG